MRLLKIIGILALFTACKDECGSPSTVPVISFDEPVYEGDYVVMKAKGKSDLTYDWQGPNGLIETGQVLEIESIQVYQTGEYVVTVSDGDCKGLSNIADVDVTPLDPPCTPPDNTAGFDLYPDQLLVFSAVNCGELDDQYVFTAKFNGGEVRIVLPEFPYYTRSYSAVASENPGRDNAMIKFIDNAANKTYLTTGSRLYLRVYLKYFRLYFCDMVFSNDEELTSGTANIVCNY